MTPQEIYKALSGTYRGAIMVANIPQQVTVVLGNDFSIKQFPLRPILSRIFTDSQQLEEAVSSSKTTTLTAATESVTVTTEQTLLYMKPAELHFTTQVNGQTYQVSSTLSSVAYTTPGYPGLTVYLEVDDLLCDGQLYDVTTEKISYLIDNATKVEE